MPEAATLARATRVKTIPVMLAPVAVGAALAHHHQVSVHLGWLALTFLGAAALHLGANVLNDYFDERTGADKLARIDRTAIATGSGALQTGAMTARGMVALAATLFAIAVAAGLVLAIARGAPVLWLGVAGAVLAVEYVGPPLRYGYVGRGLGELGIFVAFGVLPVMGSYYVHAGRFSSEALWASVVPGLFTTLVLFHHHFLHHRADKAAGKMTPVAVLGIEAGLVISGVAITLTYVALTLEVAFGIYPPWALAALVTAVPMASSWARAARDPIAQHCLNLLGATLGASVLVQVALVAAYLAG